MTDTSHKALRLIAIYKFAKMSGLLLLAIAAFGFVHEAYLDDLARWVEQLPIRNGSRFLEHGMDILLGLGPRKFLLLGSASLLYAALFAVEGWGLWTGKRWAEYLTVFATASLIPFELWEIWHHATWLKFAALAANVAIVIYLWRILHEKVRRDRSKPATA